MNTGLSRFMFASLALHAGVLAVFGSAAPRLPAFPAALSVSLDEAPAAMPQASPAAGHHAAQRPRPQPVQATSPSGSPPPSSAPAQAHQAPPAAAPDSATATATAQASDPADTASAEDGAHSQAASGPASLAPERLASQLESQLRDAIAPYFVYPQMARRKGWEGQVEVGVRVEADGRLSHLRITRSSGYRLLDNAALTALNGIDVLPGAAGWLEGRHFDMVLPIEYRLIGGQS